MLQYEFARRLASDPGGKDYGAITVMTRYESRISRLLEVGKGCIFSPKPKVGSMVIAVDLEMPHPVRAKNDRVFELVVRGGICPEAKDYKKFVEGYIKSF